MHAGTQTEFTSFFQSQQLFEELLLLRGELDELREKADLERERYVSVVPGVGSSAERLHESYFVIKLTLQ